MQFEIRTEGFELTGALHQHAQRRLDFALSRFRPHLGWVYMRLTDENGPRGGIDKRCQVRVRMPGLPRVVINELSDDLYAAIDRAADRAGCTVARRLARQEQVAQGRSSALLHSDDEEEAAHVL